MKKAVLKKLGKQAVEIYNLNKLAEKQRKDLDSLEFKFNEINDFAGKILFENTEKERLIKSIKKVLDVEKDFLTLEVGKVQKLLVEYFEKQQSKDFLF
jgi:hypothetical protein